MKIHLSGVRTFKTCRRKFDFSELQRIKPISQEVEEDDEFHPLSFGSRSHAILAKLYTGQEVTEEDYTSEEMKTLLVDYKTYYGMVGDDDPKKTVAAEQVLEVPFTVNGQEITIRFTMDRLFKKDDDFWVMEHKNYARVPDARIVDIDEQLTGYIYLCRKLGLPVTGAYLNVLVKRFHKMPPVLKSGEYSQAETYLGLCNYNLFVRTLKAEGKDIKNYQKAIEFLAQKSEDRFFRYPVVKTEDELLEWEQNFIYLLEDMLNPNVKYYPSPTGFCGNCAYFDLCKAMIRRSDVNYIRNLLYEDKQEGER